MPFFTAFFLNSLIRLPQNIYFFMIGDLKMTFKSFLKNHVHAYKTTRSSEPWLLSCLYKLSKKSFPFSTK